MHQGKQRKKKSYKENVLNKISKKKKKTGQKFSLLAKQLYGVLNLEELDFKLKIFFTKNLLSLDFHNLKKKVLQRKI